MSIIGCAPDDDYCIYFDGNDLFFPELKISLAALEQTFAKNKLGLAFLIERRDDYYNLRNDLLIAKKSINKEFFNQYFLKYAANIENKKDLYYTPKSDEQARYFAEQISNPTACFNVAIDTQPPEVVAPFGRLAESIDYVNCGNFFSYERKKEHANTWLSKEPVQTAHGLAYNLFQYGTRFSGCEPPVGSIIDSRGNTIVP